MQETIEVGENRYLIVLFKFEEMAALDNILQLTVLVFGSHCTGDSLV